MTEYLHHVPGRLRVRSKALRCDSAARGAALRRLRALEGVDSVRLNAKAASLTVYYDVEILDAERILDFLNAECLRAMPTQTARAAAMPSTPRPRHNQLTGEIARIALSVLVNKGVSYSLSSLLGARV
jgi:hypothetical protein